MANESRFRREPISLEKARGGDKQGAEEDGHRHQNKNHHDQDLGDWGGNIKIQINKTCAVCESFFTLNWLLHCLHQNIAICRNLRINTLNVYSYVSNPKSFCSLTVGLLNTDLLPWPSRRPWTPASWAGSGPPHPPSAGREPWPGEHTHYKPKQVRIITCHWHTELLNVQTQKTHITLMLQQSHQRTSHTIARISTVGSTVPAETEEQSATLFSTSDSSLWPLRW